MSVQKFHFFASDLNSVFSSPNLKERKVLYLFFLVSLWHFKVVLFLCSQYTNHILRNRRILIYNFFEYSIWSYCPIFSSFSLLKILLDLPFSIFPLRCFYWLRSIECNFLCFLLSYPGEGFDFFNHFCFRLFSPKRQKISNGFWNLILVTTKYISKAYSI